MSKCLIKRGQHIVRVFLFFDIYVLLKWQPPADLAAEKLKMLTKKQVIAFVELAIEQLTITYLSKDIMDVSLLDAYFWPNQLAFTSYLLISEFPDSYLISKFRCSKDLALALLALLLLLLHSCTNAECAVCSIFSTGLEPGRN